MANSILTDSIIVKESLRELKNQLGFTKNVNRQYDDKFAVEGAKIGDTINIRKPSRYDVTTGATLTIQDSQDQSVALQLDSQYHVGMAFSSKDLTLSVDAFKERYVKPAVTALANKVDYAGYLAMYKQVYSSVGVPSATALPSTLKGFTQAKAKLALLGAPQDELTAIVDPLVEASMVEGLKSLFQSSDQIKQQYEKGIMGYAAGSKFVSSANVVKHSSGLLGGTPAIKTTITTQGASTIDADGVSATVTGYFKAGDVIEIAGVYALNPQTKQSTGQLKQFVVLADCNAATSELASVSLSPSMYTTGAYANIDAFPADGAAITLFGHASSYANLIVPQNLVFHKDAFALGCADLALPRGVDMAARASDPESGLSIRLVADYDIVNDRKIARLDILCGWKALYPEFACRVVGQPA